jgi:hypothetical protein
MRATAALLTIALVPGAGACRGRAQTPPEVTQAYRALVSSLDEKAPGASFARLRDFARQNERYAASADAAAALDEWRGKMETAYRRGRDLAREDRFQEAAAILNDLAGVTDEAAGRQAREFLAYDFHRLEAARRLLKGDVAGATAAARELREKPLTEAQAAETERLLDSTALVDAGMRMTRTTAFESAARAIATALHGSYAEEGQYPATFALDSPALAGLRETDLLATVAAIEGYTATADTFSFVLVGKDPTQRIRITQRGVESAAP